MDKTKVPACQGRDPELWFPLPTDAAIETYAKDVCWSRCHVRTACLARSYALAKVTRHMPDGIWGGLNRDERAVIPEEMRPQLVTA